MPHGFNATLDLKIQSVLYSSILIICICIFSFTIYKIRSHLSLFTVIDINSDQQHSRPKIPKRTIYLSIVCMLGFMLNIFFQIIYCIISITVKEMVWESFTAQIPNVSSYLFMFIGQSCIQLLFISRLQTVFKSTQYKISYKTVLLFYILTMSFFTFSILVTIFHMFMHFEIVSWKTGQIMYSICFAMTGIMDFVICSILLYLFITRLFMISLLVDDRWNGQETRNKLLPIVNVITRYFILTVYSIIGLQVFLMIGGIVHGHAIFDGTQHEYDSWSLELFYYFYPFQSLIAVYCCAVNFYFGKKMYRCCCGKIHDICVDKWMMKAKHKMMNKDSDYKLLDKEQDI